jgi:hypothetical protein
MDDGHVDLRPGDLVHHDRLAGIHLQHHIIAVAAGVGDRDRPAVGVACRLADRWISPSTAVTLEPEPRVMFRKAVMLTAPLPLARMLLVVFGRLTVPASVTLSPWSVNSGNLQQIGLRRSRTSANFDVKNT